MKRYASATLLCASVLFISAACNRVSFPVSREFCGRIRVIDQQGREIPTNAALLLYRTDSDSRCCSNAQLVAEIKTDGDGSFNAGALEAGKYFLAVKNSPEVVFPLRLETDYDGKKCSLNTDFSFDKNTGKAEETVIIRVQTDMLPKKDR